MKINKMKRRPKQQFNGKGTETIHSIHTIFTEYYLRSDTSVKLSRKKRAQFAGREMFSIGSNH